MASTRERVRADGSIAWQVLYRHEGRQRSVTFDSAAARDQWVRLIDNLGLAGAIEALEAAERGGGALTLREYALTAIEARTGISEGTRERYRREIARDWKRIGSLPVHLVTERAVEQWVRSLERAGHSAKTIRNKHGLLSSVLSRAARDSTIDLAANPCEHTQLRKDDVGEEMSFLTPAEFARFLTCFPVPYRPFVAALFGTGARFGEATALDVASYVPESESVRIARAWKKVPGGWEVGPPKTRRGRRTVEVPSLLVGYCEDAVRTRAPSDLLFTTTGGGRIKHASFHGDVWAVAVRLANGEPGWPDKTRGYHPRRGSIWRGVAPLTGADRLRKRPRIHDARHTAASWMIASGATLQDVQYALGHESIQTTSDRYGHLLPGRGIVIKNAMSANLAGAHLALPSSPEG